MRIVKRSFSVGSDGVRISNAGILLPRKKDNGRLQQLISRALSGDDAAGASAGVMYGVRSSGRRPFCIAVARVSGECGMLTSFRPAVCITIADPEERTLLQVDHLMAAFGLTQAEAKLASLVATGEELRSAATTLGITYPTARARLAQIFDKTRTRRQAELVRVLLTGLAGI